MLKYWSFSIVQFFNILSDVFVYFYIWRQSAYADMFAILL